MTGISARAIAEALGRPAPTDQQAEVIEAPPDASALVIAGAGSGKTETMANRVLWLVANRHVLPEQLLGLTFTRKAAGELGVRIRERLGELTRSGLVPGDPDPFAEPTVATYNSFANSLYLENAALLGRDPDGPVLGEAAAWQLARTIVLRSDDSRMPELDRNLTPVVDAVLGLSRALAENVADPEAVRSLGRDFAEVADLESGGRGAYADVADWAANVGALDLLVELAEQYRAEKDRRSAVEYSDQVAFALQAVRARPSVGAEIRARFPIVLLDEYQDTSVVQTRLLRELFRAPDGDDGGDSSSAVTAVGDPNQSIYGWRGASASNLPDFARDFAVERTFDLATSWRNGTGILAAANAVVEPFAADGRVVALEPSPSASSHGVEVAVRQTIEEEAEATASWFEGILGADPTAPATAAILFRSRRTQPRFLAALRDHGIRYHVLGLGGLLAEPEVADLVSALTVLSDPSAGLELVRLLAGARWRVGPADLHALRGLASWMRERDDHQRRYADETVERMRASVSMTDGASLIDALDAVRWMRDDHSLLEPFSPPGLERLRDAARTLDVLRSRSGADLPDLVTLVEHELRLDIEVAANEHRPPGAAAMEAFQDALRGYLDLAEAGTLGGFLAWLRAAEQKEDLSPRPEPPEPGVVQVLTIHGAKGLEWDAVAVPRLVTEELPARQQEGTKGWLRFGELPWEFRGDARSLPELAWRETTTRKELVDLVAAFGGRVAERHAREERRLAYVAVTRARHRLLLSASFWAGQTKPRMPSPFLAELADAGLVPEIPRAPESTENPLADLEAQTFPWPRDPLGSARRRTAVERAAELVAQAEPRLSGPWADEVELLVLERAERLTASARVPLPTRVPASRFKDFVSSPDAVARGMLRPMPERPFRATRLGTLFHAWVEQRYGVTGGSDELDAEPFELDGPEPDAAPDDLDALRALQETFARSDWAARRPIEVEREIHLPFDGRIVICKIDAIYADGEGDDERFEVVDWKTGRAPADADDLERKQLQLALYRLAYARWRGIDPERIDAAFYFVADDRVIRPEHIASEEELVTRWRRAMHASDQSAMHASDRSAMHASDRSALHASDPSALHAEG